MKNHPPFSDIKTKRIYEYKWATDREWKDKFWGQRCMIIGGGYRGDGSTREYRRCEKLDAFDGKVIGCNSAYNTRALDILVFLDTSTYVNKKEEIKAFTGLKFVGAPKWDPAGFDFIAVKPAQQPMVSESFADGIGPRHLSGYFAINLALLLGFHIIFLTGFNSCNKSVIKRTKAFSWFRKWADEHERLIISTDEDGITNDFFSYTPLDAALYFHKDKKECEVCAPA